MNLLRTVGSRLSAAVLVCGATATLVGCGGAREASAGQPLTVIELPASWQDGSNGVGSPTDPDASDDVLEGLESSGPSDPAMALSVGEPSQAAPKPRLGVSLQQAAGLPSVDAVDAPVTLRLPSLGVEGSPVIAVGVEPDGSMEVPAADQVGWYRFGPEPGAEGSSVLAAHIAADGRDGVFRNLERLDRGDVFQVETAAGDVQAWRVVGLGKFDKQELPFDEIFSKSGAPRLVLITCGGEFNPRLRSYESNVVAFAEPVL